MSSNDRTQIIIPLIVIITLLCVGYFARGFVRESFSSIAFKPPSDANLEGNYPKALDEKTCIEAEGVWEELENNKYFCVYYNEDGGKECTDSLQCQGICIIREQTKKDEKVVGVCTDSSIVYGCYSEIGRYKKTGAIDCQ